MAGVTYKCTNCGGPVSFEPELQKWRCAFCKSQYTEKDLLPKAQAYAQEAAQEAAQGTDGSLQDAASGSQAGTGEVSGEADQGEQVAYHCPSCGSQVMTEATTVATHCYYCHNPVVLQGKLTPDMTPDSVLPFSINKDSAVESFLKWVKTKRFIPKDFFSKQEIRNMSGVYYPHFVTECDMDASYSGEGQNISTMDTPKYIITKTDYYAFRRRANLSFRNVMRPALSSLDRKLSDGIHPFPLEEVKPFSSAYLSGFLAERRNVDKEEIAGDVQRELEGYVRPLLSSTVNYHSSSGTASGKITRQKTQYVLLPTWVLTYTRRSGDDKKPYYYVMNGRTGEVCGKLPINKGKLFLTSALIAAALFGVLCVASYFLF